MVFARILMDFAPVYERFVAVPALASLKMGLRRSGASRWSSARWGSEAVGAFRCPMALRFGSESGHGGGRELL